MRKRKNFLKNARKTAQLSATRNLRLRRLKRRKHNIFERHALQFVVQELC